MLAKGLLIVANMGTDDFAGRSATSIIYNDYITAVRTNNIQKRPVSF